MIDIERHLKHFADLLDLSGIAGRVINEEIAEHPEDKELIGRTFALMFPNPAIDHTDLTFEAHCHEIVERVRLSLDTTWATDGEVMALLSMGSLPAPMLHDYAEALARLMRKNGIIHDATEEKYETYEGAVEEIISDIRKKFRSKDRKLDKVESMALFQH